MKRTKILVILFLLSNFINAQDFSINPKYSFLINNEFSSNEISIDLLHQIDVLNLEFGFNLGLVNMNYSEHNWQSITGSDTEYKAFWGMSANYFPLNNLNERFKPFVGVRISFVSDKHFNVGGTGGNHIMDRGYYHPSSTDDSILSGSVGTIYYLGSLNIILGLEYEYRKFNYGYDEYYNDDDNMFLLLREYEMEKILRTILLNIGVQFKF